MRQGYPGVIEYSIITELELHHLVSEPPDPCLPYTLHECVHIPQHSPQNLLLFLNSPRLRLYARFGRFKFESSAQFGWYVSRITPASTDLLGALRYKFDFLSQHA